MATMICESPPPAAVHVTHEFASSAWLTKDDTMSPGWLVYQDGALLLYDHRGNLVFDTPMEGIESVRFPWYHWGSVCCLRICGEVFRLRFNPPHGGTLAMRIQGMWQPLLQSLSHGEFGEPHAIAAAWQTVLKMSR